MSAGAIAEPVTPADLGRTGGPASLAWRRFRGNRLAMVGLATLTFAVVIVVLAPITAPHDPLAIDTKAFGKPPSSVHLLGTDGSGRDVLSRLIWGGRISLTVGLGAVALYLLIGTTIGAVSGYRGGRVGAGLMRLTDLFLALPTLLVLIALVPLLGRSVFNIVLVLGLFGWPFVARLVRGEILSLRERDFVTAARVMGATPRRIVVGHLLPNVASPLVVVATFGVAEAIIAESGLSLLGLGIQAPDASWGQMLQGAIDLSVLLAKPWIWMAPGAALAITVLAVNFIGDGLRDALDPSASTLR